MSIDVVLPQFNVLNLSWCIFLSPLQGLGVVGALTQASAFAAAWAVILRPFRPGKFHDSTLEGCDSFAPDVVYFSFAPSGLRGWWGALTQASAFAAAWAVILRPFRPGNFHDSTLEGCDSLLHWTWCIFLSPLQGLGVVGALTQASAFATAWAVILRPFRPGRGTAHRKKN